MDALEGVDDDAAWWDTVLGEDELAPIDGNGSGNNAPAPFKPLDSLMDFQGLTPISNETKGSFSGMQQHMGMVSSSNISHQISGGNYPIGSQNYGQTGSAIRRTPTNVPAASGNNVGGTGRSSRLARSKSGMSVNTLDEETSRTGGNVDILVEMFRHIRKKKKLSLQKASDEIGVPKTALSKWNSGKAEHWNQKLAVEAWINSRSNAEALKSFRQEYKKGYDMLPYNSPAVGPTSLGPGGVVVSRDPKQSSYYPGYQVPVRFNASPGIQSSNTVPGSVYSQGSGQPGYRSPYNHSPIPGQPPPPPMKYEPTSLSRSDVPRSAVPNRSPYPANPDNRYRNDAKSNGAWQQQSSIRILAEKVKQDTEPVLHKDIDSAVNDYLNTARSWKEKMIQAQKSEDPANKTAQLEYFYQQQGKVLLNRLSTICGDEVVQRAMHFLSAQKNLRTNQLGPRSVPPGPPGSETRSMALSDHAPRPSDLPSGYNSSRPASTEMQIVTRNPNPGAGGRTPANQDPMKQRMETQQMMQLTQIWNHCCNCVETECTHFSCVKIKPAVAHQRELRNQKRPCQVSNCHPCMLYHRLKSFSSSRATGSSHPYRGPGPDPTPRPYGGIPPAGSAQRQLPPHNSSSGYPRAARDQFGSATYSPHGSTIPESKSSVPGGTGPTYKPGSSAGGGSGYGTHNYTQNNVHKEQNSTQHTNYTQQNSINNNLSYSNMNVNYNTYNIHTHAKPTAATASDRPARSGRPEEEDMSTVADMLDERKHNVNINVNVNINSRNESTEYTTDEVRKERPYEGPGPEVKSESRTQYSSTPDQKRKTDAQTSYDYSTTKKPRSTYDGYTAGHGQSRGPYASGGGLDDDPLNAFLDETELGTSHFDSQAYTGNPSSYGLSGDRILCVICKEKDRVALFNPCNHCCACKECASQVMTCPMCRAPITGWSSIYLS